MLKPSQVDSIAIAGGWRSVGNPGYGSVLISKPRKPSLLLRGMAEISCTKLTLNQTYQIKGSIWMKVYDTHIYILLYKPPIYHSCVWLCIQLQRAYQSGWISSGDRQGIGRCRIEWLQQQAGRCLLQSDQAWLCVQCQVIDSFHECISCLCPRLPHVPPCLSGSEQDQWFPVPAERFQLPKLTESISWWLWWSIFILEQRLRAMWFLPPCLLPSLEFELLPH